MREYIHSLPERRRAWLLSEYLYDWMSPAALEMVAQTGTVISQGAAAVRALDGATEVLRTKAAPAECMDVECAEESVDGEGESVGNEAETEMAGPVVAVEVELVETDTVGSGESEAESMEADTAESPSARRR